MDILLTGILATAFMDAWLALLKRMGVKTLDFAMLGRWVGNIPRGRFVHASIAKAPPVRGELALGWAAHYAVGIAFAAGLFAVTGGQPTLAAALSFGLATVAAPWFVMQPAMGTGVAKNRARSLANHAVFGLGLYLAARLA